MINEQYVNALFNAVTNMAEKRGDTHIKQGVEIIKKIGGIAGELGEKLAKTPHENYPDILSHMEAIEELLNSEE